jgi:hypothetical protein
LISVLYNIYTKEIKIIHTHYTTSTNPYIKYTRGIGKGKRGRRKAKRQSEGRVGNTFELLNWIPF